jgi:hypothetical protein
LKAGFFFERGLLKLAQGLFRMPEEKDTEVRTLIKK